jgi:hypothetical protein
MLFPLFLGIEGIMKNLKASFLAYPLLFLALILFLPSPGRASACWFADLETGMVFSILNDVRIPGDTGTDLSLTNDLETPPDYFFRLRAGVTLAGRHHIFLLFAPLRLKAKGTLDHDLNFSGETFPAQTPLRADYRFDSYRLTYRYDFFRSERWELGAGLTAKIRDAAISLDGPVFREKPNTGFVPLINFSARWKFQKDWSLLLEGDALAAPQGRAEDILLALTFRLNESVEARLGYRLLEGGADNPEVYTFALINYAVLGLTASF